MESLSDLVRRSQDIERGSFPTFTLMRNRNSFEPRQVCNVKTSVEDEQFSELARGLTEDKFESLGAHVEFMGRCGRKPPKADFSKAAIEGSLFFMSLRNFQSLLISIRGDTAELGLLLSVGKIEDAYLTVKVLEPNRDPLSCVPGTKVTFSDTVTAPPVQWSKDSILLSPVELTTVSSNKIKLFAAKCESDVAKVADKCIEGPVTVTSKSLSNLVGILRLRAVR